MKCAQIENLLPLYAGNDLSAAELAAVKTHLLTCSACATEAEAFTSTRNWMVNVAPAFDEDFYAE